ncbi:MAG: choice-of-anchor D domain-containing protein, partial [Spartobacteria bacterium]|nr:choice-of-anchor D domain-containing protein [Spartobacteria bacterium]
INVLDVYNSQSNYVTWADATPSNGALSVVLFKSQALGNILNCMRISGYNGPMPATPSSGSWTGGYPVAISGENLNDGSDITNVTLCGVQATIVSQTLDHVWVTAGTSTVPGIGDIVVQSVSYGTTVGSNLFTYTGAGILVSSPPFTSVPFGSVFTNMVTVTNAGTEALVIASATNSGAGAAHFDVSALNGLTVDPGMASNVPVVFTASEIGLFNPTCYTENNSPNPNYYFGLYGRVYQTSANTGPWSGGNTIILTNGLIGSGSDITNITVSGYAATIGAQGANWVQITLGVGSTNGGAGDIVIQSTSVGESTFANAYTYNPAGVIADSSTTNAYIIGTGSLTNVASATGYGPIMFYYYSSHYQFLYQASDFATAGLTGPVRIAALGFDVVSSTDGKTLPSFLVRMKHTEVENMSGGMDGTDLTVCYSNSGYLATAGGFDMLTFDTPFEWDGSSNMIVDTAFANAGPNWCNCGQTTYDAIDSRGSAYRTDTFDTRYDFTHGSTISVLPRIRILTETVNAALEPSSGSWTGGYPVSISGVNLGNGSDITNVTLCGASATIQSQTATRVWVMAGLATASGPGDVVVQSTSYGTTVGNNLFTYTGPGILVSAPAFGPVTPGEIVTNSLTVTNTGTEALLIYAATNDGVGAAMFDVSALVNLTVDPGTASNVPVVFTAGAVGTYTPSCYTVNNSPDYFYSFGLHGRVYQISTNIGPYAGGNTLTITNGYFGAITNVLVDGVDVSAIVDSGINWVNVVMPLIGAAGTVDITVQTSDNGETILRNAYTYNPQGVIITNIPSSCSWSGNCSVVISGTDLCNGGMDDVINVTLAGVTAGVDSVNGSTQLVVTAGMSPMVVGDVVIHSISHGTAIKSNAFTYLEPVMAALGTNGAAIASGDPASPANGTYFGALLVGDGALTNTFSITNSGNIALNISHIYSNGVGYQSYVVRDCPASIAIGAVETFSVVFKPLAGGALPAQYEFYHDGTNSPYLFNVSGAGKGGGMALATNALHFETHYDGGNPAAQPVAMDNVGISAFTYTNTLAYSPGASNWLSITPPGGTLGLGGSTTLTNTVDIAGVNAGNYTCNVQIVADDATNSPQHVRATLVVAQATQTIAFAQLPDMIITDTYGLSATGGASTNPVTFSVLSGPASIAGGTNLTFNNVGEVRITANQAGDLNYLAATTVTNVFNVSPTTPVISTPTVSNILAQTASLGGTIDSTNGAPVTERGVHWRVDGDTNVYSASESGAFGTGAFSLNVTGIIAGVTNFYRAYAVNTSGTVTTVESEFLARPDAPEVTAPTNIQATSFYANWNAAEGALTYYLDVSETN